MVKNAPSNSNLRASTVLPLRPLQASVATPLRIPPSTAPSTAVPPPPPPPRDGAKAVVTNPASTALPSAIINPAPSAPPTAAKEQELEGLKVGTTFWDLTLQRQEKAQATREMALPTGMEKEELDDEQMNEETKMTYTRTDGIKYTRALPCFDDEKPTEENGTKGYRSMGSNYVGGFVSAQPGQPPFPSVTERGAAGFDTNGKPFHGGTQVGGSDGFTPGPQPTSTTLPSDYSTQQERLRNAATNATAEYPPHTHPAGAFPVHHLQTPTADPFLQKRKVQGTPQQACDSCRSLKTKCDGGRPSCINCRDKNISCGYRESSIHQLPPHTVDPFSQLLKKKKTQRTAQACDSCRCLKAKCDEGRPGCGSCKERNIPCAYRDPPPAPFTLGSNTGKEKSLYETYAEEMAGAKKKYEENSGKPVLSHNMPVVAPTLYAKYREDIAEAGRKYESARSAQLNAQAALHMTFGPFDPVTQMYKHFNMPPSPAPHPFGGFAAPQPPAQHAHYPPPSVYHHQPPYSQALPLPQSQHFGDRVMPLSAHEPHPSSDFAPSYQQFVAQGTSLITKGLEKQERELNALKSPEAYTQPFCDFLTENPTVWHAVQYFEKKLDAAGFKKLSERQNWTSTLEKGGKYYTSRNGSSLIAFTVGSNYKPGNGVAMIAGHVDALTARLKPVSSKTTKAGYVQLGVAPYAGALNSTWWDRDLGIGGRVLVKDGKTGKIETKLVKLGWPIARIPTLAPHFGVGMTGSNNTETEAVPIIGLDSSSSSSEPEFENLTLGGLGSFAATQPPKLVRAIAGELSIQDYSSIVNWELELFDTQPAQVGGLDKEFIFGGRIDDKLCSWSAMEALLASASASSTGGESDDAIVKLVGVFDDEEIGSLLRQGARGNFLPGTIERITESFAPSSSANILSQTYANSFLISADVTHAVNPNFLSRYLESHAPRLNVGLVVCADSKGHMTTDSVSTALLTRVAEKTGSELQLFMIRNDSRSGGTVGPMLSSAMGVRAIDAGIPQLSMHSIRATTGALDPGLGVKIFAGFFEHFQGVDTEFE